MARGMESDEALPDFEGQKWTCRQHVQQELTNSWMERHTINAATSGQGRQTFIAQRGEVIAPQLGKYLRDSPPLLALQVCDSAWSLFIEFYLIQFTLLNRRILNWHWDVFFCLMSELYFDISTESDFRCLIFILFGWENGAKQSSSSHISVQSVSVCFHQIQNLSDIIYMTSTIAFSLF